MAPPPQDERRPPLERLAGRLVDAGRVVPTLEVDADGRARSWWWPLPAEGERAALTGLLRRGDLDEQRGLAAALAEAVDAEVRFRLGATDPPELPPRLALPAAEVSQRVVAAWWAALGAAEPWLADLGPKARPELIRLATAVQRWVRGGRLTYGRSRLCLRVHEPPLQGGPPADRWRVELLVQDLDEPSLMVAAGELWAGRSPLPSAAIEELVASLARTARLVPQLGGLLEQSAPTSIEIDTAAVVALAGRLDALADSGIGVLLPAWWTNRARLGVRLKAKGTARPASVTGGSLSFDHLVEFSWSAVLGDARLTRADLRRLVRAAEAKSRLVRVRGQWVEVRPDEVARIVALLDHRGHSTLPEVLRAALGMGGGALLPEGLDELGGSVEDGDADRAEEGGTAGGLEIEGVDASGWLRRLLEDTLSATATPIPTPAGFVGALRPYQELGVGWLTFLGRLGLGACLADDMGLGKTAQLIASLLVEPAAGPTLVVCPVSVLGNWQRELERFAPQLAVHVQHGPGRPSDATDPAALRTLRSADVVLSTYSLLDRDLELLSAISWDRLVLDEAQQIKNPSSRAARAARRLPAARRVALTGTPVENRLSELWSIMAVLNPGLLGSAAAFRDEFAVPIERHDDEVAAGRLRRLTAPFLLRRLKTDRSIIDDLPDKIETVQRCPLTREQASLYQAVVDDLLARAAEADGIGRRGLVLAGLLRLKQVCNHPALLLGDGSPLAGRSGKLLRAEELLEEVLEAGERVLCFTQFAQWGELVVPHLARRFGVEVGWLHGGLARSRRDRLVERFMGDGPPVLVISLKAGGTGLNLTAATQVIHLDRWWNPAVEDQATDRAYRIGQKRTVQVHKLVSQGTVEERIDALIDAKRALAAKVVGTGERWLTELSTDELADLVRLQTGYR